MLRSLVALCLVLQAAPAFADPAFVASGRIGIGHSDIVEEQVDGSREGFGGTFGLELGLAIEHIRPAIAIDLGQVSATNAGDKYDGDFTMRERTVTISARIHVDITDFFDLFAGYGSIGLYEHRDTWTNSRHTWGSETQLGLGVRVWDDDRQSVRIEAAVSWANFDPDNDPITLTRVGVSASYSWRF